VAHFTPISALIGGVLIGSAAGLLLWLDGRIAGISGILGGLLPPQRNDTVWRILFLLGLIAGAALVYAFHANLPQARPAFPRGLLVSAGLLVGLGTRLARGCTSGHGVCGLARLSPRSLAATLTFLLVAMATTFIVRHVAGIV
jgi:uncharacterized protein